MEAGSTTPVTVRSDSRIVSASLDLGTSPSGFNTWSTCFETCSNLCRWYAYQNQAATVARNAISASGLAAAAGSALNACWRNCMLKLAEGSRKPAYVASPDCPARGITRGRTLGIDLGVDRTT